MGVLIDSPEMLQAKRRIMLNQPHLEHASGSLFTCDFAEPPLKNVIVNVGPDQRGSGTPTGTNIRWLYGRSTADFSIGNQSYSKSLGVALFGGSYNCDTGLILSKYTSQSATSSSSFSSFSDRGNSVIFWIYYSAVLIYNNPAVPLYSNMFTFVGYHYNYDTVPDWSFAGSSSYKNSVWFKIPKSVLSEVSLNGVKQWVAQNGNIQIVGPRNSGTTSSSTTTLSVSAPRGIQTVDAVYPNNTISFDYWTH